MVWFHEDLYVQRSSRRFWVAQKDGGVYGGLTKHIHLARLYVCVFYCASYSNFCDMILL
jgi:hypothetical protein